MVGIRSIRSLAGVVLGAILIAAPASAQPLEIPPPTGPHPVGRVDVHLVDQARQDPWRTDRRRELMVSIWYPARTTKGAPPAAYMPPGVARPFLEALLKPIGQDPARVDLSAVRVHAFEGVAANTRSGPFPVVAYSPGGNQPRAVGTALVTDLASRGYVVVTVDHTFEAPAVEFPGGRLEASALPKGEGVLQRMLAVRVADTRFVLSQLKGPARRRLPGGLARALDLSRVGMFGHSAGGFTALQAMAQDRRIDAAANLDGSLAYSMSKAVYGDVVEQGLDRPFLLMGAGTSGRERRPHTHAGAPDWRRLWERSRGWKRDLYIETAEHMSFADHTVLLPAVARELGLPPQLMRSALGTGDPARMLAIQRAYLAAFFDAHLKGERQPLLEASSPRYPEARFVD